jgi:hypothetical protein
MSLKLIDGGVENSKGMVSMEFHEFIVSDMTNAQARVINHNVNLMNENEGLRALCEELKEMVSKLREKMVEQDVMLEKLIIQSIRVVN